MSDDLLQHLRDSAPPADEAWATSPAGLRVMRRAASQGCMAEPSPPRRTARKAAALSAVVLAVAGIAGTAVAQLNYRTPNDVNAVLCYEELDLQANGFGGFATADSAVARCRKEWPSATGRPAPENLVMCVVPGGGRGVFPAPVGGTAEQICPTIDSTPEQPT